MQFFFKRTTTKDFEFQKLVSALDKELVERNGDVQAQYDPYNNVDAVNTAIVVVKDGEPIGCGCFKKYDEYGVEIKRMYVVPEYREKGVASSILSELEEWAKAMKSQYVLLETGVNMAEAIAMYQKQGYNLIDNYGPFVGMEDSYCFKKEF